MIEDTTLRLKELSESESAKARLLQRGLTMPIDRPMPSIGNRPLSKLAAHVLSCGKNHDQKRTNANWQRVHGLDGLRFGEEE